MRVAQWTLLSRTACFGTGHVPVQPRVVLVEAAPHFKDQPTATENTMSHLTETGAPKKTMGESWSVIVEYSSQWWCLSANVSPPPSSLSRHFISWIRLFLSWGGKINAHPARCETTLPPSEDPKIGGNRYILFRTSSPQREAEGARGTSSLGVGSGRKKMTTVRNGGASRAHHVRWPIRGSTAGTHAGVGVVLWGWHVRRTRRPLRGKSGL